MSGLFTPEKTKLPVIQALRAVAALAVAWTHISHGLFPGTLLAAWSLQGYLGVYVFFVISGFIVPYAMFHAGYKVRNFWTFMAKRMTRVEPPYLVSIVVSIGMWWLSGFSTLYQGGAPRVTWPQLALHLGYLIPFFPKYEWISGVYWSLAVEFQYYIVLSLVFPLLISRRAAVRISACLLLASVCLVFPHQGDGPHRLLVDVAPIFVLGIAAMLHMVGVSSRRELVCVAVACLALTYRSLWIEVVITVFLTFGCILWVKRAPAVLLLIGDISYSLYLLHDMVGRRVVHFGDRFVPQRFAGILPFVALLVSLACAWAMYRIVERPAKKWASRIKYKKPDPHATGTIRTAAA